MEQLKILRDWICQFPLWGDMPLHVDTLSAQPENAGLYPLGMEVLERKTDLLGNVTERCRQKFDLLRAVVPGEDPAKWMLGFAQWVQQQGVLGLAPRFGDVPAAEQIRAEKGRLKEITAAGTAVYVVTITAEYMKMMEENEHGKH